MDKPKWTFPTAYARRKDKSLTKKQYEAKYGTKPPVVIPQGKVTLRLIQGGKR